MRAKGHDTFCPVGPWIVTDLDPSDLEIRTEVNGGVRAERTSLMIPRHWRGSSDSSAVADSAPRRSHSTGTPAGSDRWSTVTP